MTPHLSCVAAQFVGPWNGATWNACALHAKASSLNVLRTTRERHLARLLGACDFVAVQETHSTQGSSALTLEHSRTQRMRYWNHGTSSAGGTALFVRKQFLDKRFSLDECRWSIVEPSRLARLSCRGGSGALDVWVVYASAGSRAARRSTLLFLARGVAPRASVLSVVPGDFNSVEEAFDRVSRGDQLSHGNEAEAKEWEELVFAPAGLTSLINHTHTRVGAQSASLIDRIYSNHGGSDQLLQDHFTIVVIPHNHLSDHRALIGGRRLRGRAGHQVIPKWVTERHSWHSLVGRCYRVYNPAG